MQPSVISLLLLGVSLGSASPSGPPEVKLDRGDCPVNWYSFNGRCYTYVDARMTWTDAELHCVSQNANLVSIHSPEENNFVTSLIRNFEVNPRQTWIGLSDVHMEKRWMWSDGCPVNFQFWHDKQPDNSYDTEHCAEIFWVKRPEWNDDTCSIAHPSVCASRKPVC